MERQLLLLLTLLALLLGCGFAITRPALYRIGQEGTPRARGAVAFRGRTVGGRWQPVAGQRTWGGFQGRGPSGAK
ncbi:MAG: hypothetical protein R6U00_11115 [Prochlorococcaceae cyanobacterium]|jgi:hypothetical protein